VAPAFHCCQTVADSFSEKPTLVLMHSLAIVHQEVVQRPLESKAAFFAKEMSWLSTASS
jgi:hypothetical protein